MSIMCTKCKIKINERESVKDIEELDTDVWHRVVSKVLQSANTYEAVTKRFVCSAMRDDHFRPNEQCRLEAAFRITAFTQMQDNAASRVIKHGGTVVSLDHRSFRVFMSVFNKKEDKRLGDSDLTGDGGQCAWSVLKQRQLTSYFATVCDIGAQDNDFVKKFEDPVTRYVVDINILTPYLQTEQCNVNYLIGDAATVLEGRFLRNRPVIFAMSNFLNVLPPQVAWNCIDRIQALMQEGDYMVITNLRKSQFSRRIRYVPGTEDRGLVPFMTEGDNQFYKTTIARKKFIEHFTMAEQILSDHVRKFELVYATPNSKNSIQFITLLFKCVNLSSERNSSGSFHLSE